MRRLSVYRCVKIVRIRSFSGPHFPAFGLNTETYSVNPVFSLNVGECGPEKFQIRILFTQCISLNLIAFLQDYILECSRPFINFDREIVSGAFKTISNIYDGAFS